ncbi:MAG: class 3 adenylate cyclase/tetratricopeptide (TPR) repeat protein, partial [Myxococcota bacterium]
MNCSNCSHENRPTAKFCEECATPLAQTCTGCGATLRPTAKFCDECATPTGAEPRSAPSPPVEAVLPVDTRKIVTIVFADLAGSTAMQERLDPESVRSFMESYYDAMRKAVESHGGTVTQFLGDGVKAVFGIPRVAEDDAIRAVRAGVAMQESFRALAEEQRGAVGATGLRVAVNTGEVVANDETEIIGDPVNVAARLQEQGEDGDVVVGESTHRLVSTLATLNVLGSFTLKGRAEPVKAYRVISLDRPAGAATAPFVGRDDELARLDNVYESAVNKPAAGLAVVVGSPGLGKSRMIEEFVRRHADVATIVHAHCAAEAAASFAPLAVALRERLGIESGADEDSQRATVKASLTAGEPDGDRIAEGIVALLSGTSTSPEEAFFVVRRLLGALATQQPVVLVIDDLHWAEPLLLDLVEHLIQWGGGVPLLVLIGARPELRDVRSTLTTPGGLVSDVVTLTGLDAGAAMRLAANVIGASDLPAAIAAKVLATSEGNPLFVSELVRMLVDEGALTKDGDRWTAGANLAALEMPPTVHALLAARIERLGAGERALLERAAVVGRHFSRSSVAALLSSDRDLDAQLETLQRSELIERDTGWLLGEPVLRFHHALIRDAAYRRLLKGTRSGLHAKLANWFEAQAGDAPEHDEAIGWHFEQAHSSLRQLGPLSADAKTLGDRAATRLSAAGRRALAGDDVPLAASLLGRAVECLDPNDAARADLALDWCEALLSGGEVADAARAITELGRFSKDSERLGAWQACFGAQLSVLTQPEALQAAANTVAAAATKLTELGDAAGEAKAHSVHAQALARLGKIGACEEALDLALAAARRAGDRRRANSVLAGAPIAALWGPSPVTRASGRCLDVVRVLRITQGAPAVESVALSCQGVLEALRGRTDAARRMIASSRKMVEELGIASRLFEADVFAARIEAMEGETKAAETLLRGAYDGLRDLGLGIDAAIAGALLAQTLLAQERIDEAEALSHESEALAGDDLQAAIAWRGVRAEALAKRGEHGEAIELAKAAVAIASSTDALLYHADACMALAAALRAAGRRSEASAEEHRAVELWESKGATLLVERAQ